MFLAEANLLVAAANEDATAINILRKNMYTRNIHYAYDMPDQDFIKKYRLTKGVTSTLIYELTHSGYLYEPECAQGLDPVTKVLIALNFFATGSYQTQVGDAKMHCVSQMSVSRAINEVAIALNHIAPAHIKFPVSPEERHQTQQRFYELGHIPGVLGCIDGTHVSIISPSEHEERYINRKGYHSLNVLIICNADMRITTVDPSYPGSTHDSTVWNHHPVKEYMEELATNSNEYIYLLGDSGYPLRQTLLTPILNTTPGTPEALYTSMQIKTRSIVERCIGILKARFRCLLAARALHYKPDTAARIINACCVLHNLACENNIPYVPLTAVEQAQEALLVRGASIRSVRGVNVELQRGRLVRDALVQRLWSSQ